VFASRSARAQKRRPRLEGGHTLRAGQQRVVALIDRALPRVHDLLLGLCYQSIYLASPAAALHHRSRHALCTAPVLAALQSAQHSPQVLEVASDGLAHIHGVILTHAAASVAAEEGAHRRLGWEAETDLLAARTEGARQLLQLQCRGCRACEDDMRELRLGQMKSPAEQLEEVRLPSACPQLVDV
jgi:hypothetical protein